MSRPSAAAQSLLQNLSGYVDGGFLQPVAGPLTVCDPATGAAIAHLPHYGATETREAIEAASGALHARVTRSQRRVWLERIARAHVEHREALAEIITQENGKPLVEARSEVDYAASFYTECSRHVERLQPRRLSGTTRGHDWTIFSRPAGVAGLIVPWNFPLAMLAKKASAALAAGAPIVVKPSEKTPLSSIALFHLLHGLDLPPGMVNLVFGDAPAIGQMLCEHPAVRVISFTGSTAVGKRLSARAAPHVKRMALELGGNAPYIVFDDADLERAASELTSNKFRCSGQTCVCSNRVYVQRGVVEPFVKLVAERMARLRAGPGTDPATTLGPLIDRQGFAKVRELVGDAIERGAQVVLGGAAALPAEGEGWFYPATLLTGVSPSARCLREEVFGPVVPVLAFETDQDALEAANDTHHGLAAYVFSGDEERAQRVIERLRFGHVGLNCATGPTSAAPFGGMKQSGLGREGGEEGVLEYVELQTVPSPASA